MKGMYKNFQKRQRPAAAAARRRGGSVSRLHKSEENESVIGAWDATPKTFEYDLLHSAERLPHFSRFIIYSRSTLPRHAQTITNYVRVTATHPSLLAQF